LPNNGADGVPVASVLYCIMLLFVYILAV
jgi:hypothetical protein